MTRCGFCLEPGHVKADCPKVGVIVMHTEEPSTPDDVHDALMLRCHQLRAALRGVIAEMRASGVEPSPETLALAPSDSFDP